MVEWRVSEGLVAYPDALAWMEARVEAILAGRARECVWMLEHPPLYTAGTSARASDLIEPHRFPVYRTRRGGQYTYHGPGQRVAYVMLDLNRRGRDVRRFVATLEAWIIDALGDFGLSAGTRPGRVGVWVSRPERRPRPDGGMAEAKIAAIGVRLRRWVSFHGVAVNVEPDLSHYAGIIPCGISEHGVTSLVDLGLPVAMADLDLALARHFERRFPALGPGAKSNPAAGPRVAGTTSLRSGSQP